MQEKLFFRAVKDGDFQEVKSLVLEEPDLVYAVDRDLSTGLHWAAWKGHDEIINFLLDVGADIHAHNENGHWGTTALHAAAHGNRKSAAEVLIQRGANVNALKSTGQGTPLAECRVHNASPVARLLEAHGAVE